MTTLREEAEARAKEEERQRDPVPGWVTRLVPGCIIECSIEAENTDAVDGAARLIDIIIFTHIKRRYRPFYGSMVEIDVKDYMQRVQDYGSIPESDNCFPFLGTDITGELIMPTDKDMAAFFEKKSKNNLVGDRDLETFIRGTTGARIIA